MRKLFQFFEKRTAGRKSNSAFDYLKKNLPNFRERATDHKKEREEEQAK